MTGAELRALREALGLSRPDLAGLAGLHPDSIKYWERKAEVNLRAHAVRLILAELRWGELSARRARTPARHGVLGAFPDASLTPEPWEARVALALGRWHRQETCGARTRSGKPCKRRPGSIFQRHCRIHGGLSTGPRTQEGRNRIAEAQRERWRKWREN